MKIYNSLTKQKQELSPLTPGKVGIYVCGMTVYDRCHIGHARVFVVFDSFVRFLRARGLEVNYVRNITDIDDKIVSRALAEHTTTDAIVSKYIALMHEDTDALGTLRPDVEPRVSDNIPQIITFIEELIQNGHAYATNKGNVYFDVSSYQDYGQLSHKNLDDLITNVRIQNEQDKRNELDFALWKICDDEFIWDSPWGRGRPGWHIECSVMSSRFLGDDFDIHAGGIDLLFPHHENERAQSCSNRSSCFAALWMHAGHLKIEGEKMSKSLGNFITINDILKEYKRDTIRFCMLRTHYRSPLDFSDKTLLESYQALRKIYLAIDGVETTLDTEHPLKYSFYEALEDDFNSPKAISIIFDILNELNEKGANKSLLASVIKECLIVLGFLSERPSVSLWKPGVSVEFVEKKLEHRRGLRTAKEYAKSDAIRDELELLGVAVKD